MKKIVFLLLLVFSLIPIFFYWHIVEDDFVDTIAVADGIIKMQKFCYRSYVEYVGEKGMSGYSLRPYLPALLLSVFFRLFGHNLSAIFFTFIVPRLLPTIVVFLISRLYRGYLQSFLIATLTTFVMFFQTYALSSLKSDSFVVLLTAICLYLYLRWEKTNNKKFLFWGGCAAGLNLLSKETALPFVLVFVLYVLIKLYKRHAVKFSGLYLMPITILYGLYLTVNFLNTHKASLSFFTPKLYFTSFWSTMKTYLLSFFYYAGVNFNVSNRFTLESCLILIFISLGVWYCIKSKKTIMVMLPLSFLIFIGLLNPRYIQADIVGNNEILHRISPLVIFLVLYLGFASDYIQSKIHCGSIPLIIISLLFIWRYFSAPYAQDYTSHEFYVKAPIMFTFRKNFPFSDFRIQEGLCVVKTYPQQEFMTSSLRKYKSSPFAFGYKESLLLLWVSGILFLTGYERFKNNYSD